MFTHDFLIFLYKIIALWCNWLTRLTLDQKSPGSSPGRAVVLNLICF